MGDLFDYAVCKKCDHLVDEHRFLGCDGVENENCDDVWALCMTCKAYCQKCSKQHKEPSKPSSSSVSVLTGVKSSEGSHGQASTLSQGRDSSLKRQHEEL